MSALTESSVTVCRSSDGEPAKQLFDFGIRDAIIAAPDFMRVILERAGWLKKAVDDVGLYCHYINIRPTWGKRRTPVNTEEMAERWEKLIVGLATAHSKDELDRWEHDIDDYLTPILSAPVKQVREFFAKLVARLKANERVPLFVWHSMEVWADSVVKNAPDQEVIELKTDLAREVAMLVEEDVKRDVGEALIGALMWRSEDQLRRVKELIEKERAAGGTVKVNAERRAVGRQSCLFLIVRHDGGEEAIML